MALRHSALLNQWAAGATGLSVLLGVVTWVIDRPLLRHVCEIWRAKSGREAASSEDPPSKFLYELADRMFRWGEQLIILSAVAAAWTKSHYDSTVALFATLILVAWSAGIAFWISNYTKRIWLAAIIAASLCFTILFWGVPYLDRLISQLM